MALSKGKKVLIAIVGAVVTIGAVIGTVFAVNIKTSTRHGCKSNISN